MSTINLHYERLGRGAPLLLLHGFSGSSRDFEQLFDLGELAGEHELLIPDLRGHGRTDNPEPGFSQRQCALDVAAWLAELGAGEVCALGVSLGANTLLHLATLEPERVRAMVLVSPTPYYVQAARELMRAARFDQLGEPLASRMRDQARAIAESYDDVSFTPPELGRIGARTLIVNGDRDPLVPVELSLELYRALPSASLWLVPNAGHAPVFGDARQEFVRVAREFLRP